MKAESKQVAIISTLVMVLIAGIIYGLYFRDDNSNKSGAVYERKMPEKKKSSSSNRINRDVGNFNLGGPN